MNKQYEQIKFESWQELAKYVIDGGEVYFHNEKITFDVDESCFNFVFTDHVRNNLYIKKQPTLQELIAIKPRLCWVWDGFCDERRVEIINRCNNGKYYHNTVWWSNAQMLTDDEIKHFLSE